MYKSGSPGRLHASILALVCISGSLLPLVPAMAQQSSTPRVNLNDLGSEGRMLAARVGLWDVTETVWASPTAAPVTSAGLVAERTMMGSLLQETIRKPGQALGDAVQRTDLLSFNRLEGRWGYVSFDTRAPVGLMPAWSTGSGDGKTINLIFTPFAVPAAASATTGQFIQMEQSIRFETADRDVKDQFFTLADGTATRWLAHRYEYTRHR